MSEESKERRERNQRKNLEQSGRDQRIFSSTIRSAFGGQRPRGSNRRNNEAPREIEPKYQSIDEALQDLNKALTQPHISLEEFEVYIRQNATKFGEQECQEVASKLIAYALESGEFRFFLKMCTDCIKHMNLMDAIAQELVLAANEYLVNGDVEKQAVPELFGHLIGTRWPPGTGKAIESVNPVLFVGLNVVLSWIGIMKNYGDQTSSTATTPENEKKELPKQESNGSEEGNAESNTEHENVEQKEEEEVYDQNTAVLASIAICGVCNVAQRNFWLNYLETFDEVYAVTKQLLVNPNAQLPRKVKESLLQLFTSLFKWSATNQAKFTSTSTQTAS
ncbi:hypothetical protein M3Y97_00066000 [Aphelenchoides bicaudatus]|nr:hypothetical protein M3Y97_00066000 [Aphelenchoides bicaudatus]